MRGDKVYYKAGYKYLLARYFSIDLKLFVPFPRLPQDIVTELITLSKDGVMHFARLYAWDGCSGPTKDDKTNHRGGLVHDGGYQLLRLGLLPPEYKEVFDNLLREICLDDGMWRIRAWYYFEGVDHFAAYAAKYGSDPYPILEAP